MCSRDFFRKQRLVALAIFALIVTAAALWYSTAVGSEKYPVLAVWTSTENDVKVEVDVIRYPSARPRLSAAFTPTREHFYLYSKDLPKNGLNGLGRPTLLEIIRSEAVKSTGPLEADQPVQNIDVEALGMSFPVYPAGPVVLSLPFERSPTHTSISMEISITYMACSEKTCLPPVIDKHISIQIPASFFDD